jgi:hypothetical protein
MPCSPDNIEVIALIAVSLLSFDFHTHADGVQPDQLLGSSPACTAVRQETAAAKTCDPKKPTLAGPIDGKAAAMKLIGRNLATRLRSKYFTAVQASLRMQFATAAWISNGNPADGKGDLKNAIEGVRKSCSAEMPDATNGLTAGLAKLKPGDELGIAQLSTAKQNEARDFVMKRYAIAWLEDNRIRRFLTSIPLKPEQQNAMSDRLKKIHETFPMIAAQESGKALNDAFAIDYLDVNDPDGLASHPEIDRILFPQNGVYQEVQAGQTRNGSEGLVNKMLSAPLSPRVQQELQALMNSSLQKSFRAAETLCQLQPCQVMDIDHQESAATIGSLTEEEGPLAVKSACACDLGGETSFIPRGAKKSTLAAGLAGISVCLVSGGMPCLVAGVVGSALTAAVGADNAVGGMIDLSRYSQTSNAAAAIPSLTDAERARLRKETQDAMTRTMVGSAETALAVGSIAGDVPNLRQIRQLPVATTEAVTKALDSTAKAKVFVDKGNLGAYVRNPETQKEIEVVYFPLGYGPRNPGSAHLTVRVDDKLYHINSEGVHAEDFEKYMATRFEKGHDGFGYAYTATPEERTAVADFFTKNPTLKFDKFKQNCSETVCMALDHAGVMHLSKREAFDPLLSHLIIKHAARPGHQTVYMHGSKMPSEFNMEQLKFRKYAYGPMVKPYLGYSMAPASAVVLYNLIRRAQAGDQPEE